MSSEAQFEEIKKYFVALDQKKEDNEEKLVYETDKGIFGTTNIEDIYKWLSEHITDANTVFLDLGSGDGRVNIVADLFCISKGIEFDEDLVQQSLRHVMNLQSGAQITQGDYEDADFSDVDILFCYADHNFSKEFEEKLSKEFHGTLYIYQGTFFPSNAEKQKTTWIGQTPLMAYKFP